MSYIRVSVTAPREGHREGVLKIEDALLSSFKTLPGFIEGYRLTSSMQIGRVTVWTSAADADAAANAQHTLALRSQMLPLLGDQFEYGFDAEKV